MSPKIKMSDIHDDRDDDIIELSDEELKEILADDDFDDSEEYGEIHSFVFSNPDPYAKVEPRPDDAPKREFTFDEKGNIVVKNLSAFWLPDVKIVDEIGGTEYTVTGSHSLPTLRFPPAQTPYLKTKTATLSGSCFHFCIWATKKIFLRFAIRI